MKEVNEKDWKLFRSKIEEWNERYFNKVNQEYINILKGDESETTKYWKLRDKLKENKKDAIFQIEMRRSYLHINMINLMVDEIITKDDLEGFSEEFIEDILFVSQYNK